MCPAYILPHWAEFKKKVQSYLNAGSASVTPTQTPTPATKQLYRVRKSWTDAKSQLGAYSSLESAKKVCKAGYTVFDAAGNAVYTNGSKYAKGQKVQLYKSKTQLFANDTTATPAGYLTPGTYYIYDGIACKNGRYRITTTSENCGKKPAGKYVTGYVSVDNFREV